MFETWLIVFNIVLLLGLVFSLYFIKQKLTAFSQHPASELINLVSNWISDLRSGMDRQSEIISRQLFSAGEAMNQRLESTAHLLRLVNKDLGEIHQVGEQMRDFQNFFRTPQLRGKLGEQMLNELLYQMIPRSLIKLQHRFTNGAIIDALLVLDQGMLAIDAKFPMENIQKAFKAPSDDLASSYRKEFFKDVHRHIQVVHTKYIQPQEGTLDFAVIYVPSETIYYEILQNDKLLREAEESNILLVSPHSFFYLLRLIVQGLYSSKLEKSAATVLQHTQALQIGSADLLKELSTLVTHLNNAKNSCDRVLYRADNLAGKIEEMTLLKQDEVRH